MSTAIQFETSAWWLLACVAIGIAYAALLYWNEKRIGSAIGKQTWLFWLLSALRATCVTAILVLLMAPFLKMRFTKEQKPIVAILQDNSESVKQSFKGADSATFSSKLNDIKAQLGEKFEVVTFTTGNGNAAPFDFSFGSKQTNLSQAIENINQQFYNRNLGSIILASDGIYNEGVNPVYAASNTNCSIYTIAIGDTTLQRDLKFGNILFNKTTYLNEQLAVRIPVEATNLSGNSAELKVELIESETDKKVVYNKSFSISTQQTNQTFDALIPSEKVGVIHYRLTLTQLSGEVSYKNNVRDIYVEVLDGRQQILIVANAPHPDISAFKNAIESSKNFSVKVVNVETFNEPLNEYSLIVTHQLPSIKNKAADLFSKITKSDKPTLFVIGGQSNFREFQQLQTVLNINSAGDKYNEVGALFNNNFSLFTLSSTTQDAITKLPPLAVPFGNFNTNPASQTLLTQRINNVSTDFPLITFLENGDSKTGVICGEGIWRWRLYDFMLNKSHNATNELITKSIQYLCVKTDKRPFRVMMPKVIFNDNEEIIFDAQLLNANFELINKPDVDILLTNKQGNTYPFTFQRTENSYTLNAGNLPVGDYSFVAKTKLGNIDYRASGKFSVSPLQLEGLRTRADYEVLWQLAAQHNGKMYHLNNMETLADELLNTPTLKPVLYDTYVTESAINLKWILLLFILLLTVEWFVRKFIGAY